MKRCFRVLEKIVAVHNGRIVKSSFKKKTKSLAWLKNVKEILQFQICYNAKLWNFSITKYTYTYILGNVNKCNNNIRLVTIEIGNIFDLNRKIIL